MNEQKLFAIGASAGGVNAVRDILRHLPKEFTSPLCVVQHVAEGPKPPFALVYDGQRPMLEIEDKMPIEKNHVYFCPGGYHALVESGNIFALSQDDPVHYARPSIDVFFESAARAKGSDFVATLLTGANEDGAEGLRIVQEQGGITIVQNLEEAEFPTMPAAALQKCIPNFVVKVSEVPSLFLQLSQRTPL